MAGLGRFLTRRASVQARTITEFAVIDGVAVDGSGESGSRYRGGMSIPGAWRCAVLLSDLLGGVPWHAYRERAGLPVQRVVPTPSLLEQPAPPDVRMTTFSSWALDLIWHGNAIGVVAARDRSGWPTAALPVPANMVGVRRVTANSWSPLPVGAIEYAVGELRLGVHDVIHIKGPCEPGALRGMGVLEAHLSGTLALSRELGRQAASLSRHGVPTGVLRSTNPEATEEDLKAAKAGWLAAQRDRTVAALNATTEFEPLAWNPEQLQLVESRKFALHELALIFGLPLSFLGAEASSKTYRNSEHEGIDLLKFSLGGHLARFEQTLTQHFPRGTRITADLDRLLRADTLSRFQAYALGRTGGWLTLDEIREREDLPPLPEPPDPEPPVPPAPSSPEEGTDDDQ
ncbi:MAG TPA: phage portal protein [Pseudonocardiaceae bacterium]